MTDKRRNEIEEFVTMMACRGMQLIFGDKILTCVEVVDDDDYGRFYDGKRYVFDNGVKWTIGDICSNIELQETRGVKWYIG